jgi:hypothetical protein
MFSFEKSGSKRSFIGTFIQNLGHFPEAKPSVNTRPPSSSEFEGTVHQSFTAVPVPTMPELSRITNRVLLRIGPRIEAKARRDR